MILPRKIITASISGSLFAIILGLVAPDPFGEEYLSSIQGYLFSASSVVPIYMMYSFPVILIYGVTMSIISDKAGEFISFKLGKNKIELIVSGVLHIIFGLILFWFSLVASLLFFITDRIMKSRNKKYEMKEAIKSLLIPVFVYLIFMGIVWGNQ